MERLPSLNKLNNESTPDLLVKNLETQNKEVFSFFNFSEKNILDFWGKQEILNKMWLNFWKILLWYRKYINENLSGLNPVIINKIKKSIKIKVLNSANKIDDILEEAKENNENIVNYRWVINERIWDELWFINYKLLPTANLYLNKDNIDFWYFDKNKKIEEIEEMFESEVNEDGDFDEWFFSLQVVFNYESSIDSKVLEYNKVEKVVWVDMLSEKDRKIEWDLMLKYIAFVSTMMIPYAWAATSVPSDFTDLFWSDEWVFSTMWSYGLLNENELNYKMDKHFYDSLFWFAWLIGTAFGVQWIMKMPKIAKIVLKLEKLWIKKSLIFKSISDYKKRFSSIIYKWSEATKKTVKSAFNNTEKNKGTWIWSKEVLLIKWKIKETFNIELIKKDILNLDNYELLKFNIILDIDKKFINNPKYIEKYISEYFIYLKENLSKAELSKLEVVIWSENKYIYSTEKENIDLSFDIINQIKKNSDKFWFKIYFKIEPWLIKTNTWSEVINYFSIAELIAKSAMHDLQDYIVLWSRWDIDSMANLSMISSVENSIRFSQYDTIVHNAILNFNKTKDPSKFIEDIYLAVKDSKEFSKWTKEIYWDKKSSLAKLIKILDKKWWISNDLNKKEFTWKMWRSFDEIEYLDKTIPKVMLKKWFKKIPSLKRAIEKILKNNWLDLFKWWYEDISVKFVDNWIIWKDKLLDLEKIHDDYKWATEKAWFQVQLTIKDNNWEAYEWWLFIPLKSDWKEEIMRPEFIYKDIDAKNDKINDLKWLIIWSWVDRSLLEKIIEKIDKWDLNKLEKEGFTISTDVLRLYWNLVENWYYKQTNFYDFVKNAPKDIRILSELDAKTTLSAKLTTKYNSYSFNSQNFEKVPTSYVSVFHYTTLDGLKDIAMDWLVPRWILMEKDIYIAANASPLNVKIAKEYDKTAPKWFSRNKSVYWYLSQKLDWERNYWKWWICLEMKVDPKKVLVADADEVTDDYEFLIMAKKWTEVNWSWYWWWAMTLFKYNKLSIEEQKWLFRHPEVIIPWWVEKDLIRIVTNT